MVLLISTPPPSIPAVHFPYGLCVLQLNADQLERALQKILSGIKEKERSLHSENIRLYATGEHFDLLYCHAIIAVFVGCQLLSQ